MLILRASDDIDEAEVNNVATLAELYKIETTINDIDSYDTLYSVLNYGIKYDYIYLATHGCETSFGNISGSLDVKWLDFAATVCSSGIANQGALFFHSCCKGGLSQVAWEMFASCPSIEYVCGPRHNVFPTDLTTVFNLYLYYIEMKGIDPVRAAEKALLATDIRLVCFDRLETCIEYSYLHHCHNIDDKIQEAFIKLADYEIKNSK
jgi:hypothetical protein